ncbi:MAG: hypothetical protein NZ528_03495 [Caldilineales bacterium]|nr:hypothetical protein [Caldilineales bacterium]MDW8317427.1 hypothetical protein [Anaerolineae bacterium]
MTEEQGQRAQQVEAKAAPQRRGLLSRAVGMGMGAATLGMSALRGQVRQLVGADNAAPAEELTGVARLVEGAVDGAVGLAVVSAEAAQQGLEAVLEVNRRVWEGTAPLRRPVQAVADLALAPARAVTAQVEPALNRLQERGQEELAASQRLMLGTIADIVDAVVAYLADSPEVDRLIRIQLERVLPRLADHPAVAELVRAQVEAILPKLADHPAVYQLIEAQVRQLMDSGVVQQLIQTQAARYLQHLADHPDVLQALIRTQGDAYIEYLNQNPEPVQRLVSGQSRGLVEELRDEARERAVTADSAVEMLVRTLLRRPQRSELPPPPEPVVRRAESAVLPSDYIPPKRKNDDGR